MIPAVMFVAFGVGALATFASDMNGFVGIGAGVAVGVVMVIFWPDKKK